MGWGRSPRARLTTSHPGGSGTPAGRHYDRSAGSLLDWDCGGGMSACRSSQEARPGVEPLSLRAVASAAVERREAGVLSSRRMRRARQART